MDDVKRYEQFLEDVQRAINEISGSAESADRFRRYWMDRCEPSWLEAFEIDLVDIFREEGVPYPLPKTPVNRTQTLLG